MEEPEEFRIEAKYHRSITKKLQHTISKLRGAPYVDKLIIQGRDDQDFSKVFNNDSFTKKIIFYVDKHDDGLYSEFLVKQELLKKLEIS